MNQSKMKKVLILDPGYSLKCGYNEWKEGNFPGSVLYGANHLTEYGYFPVFEELNPPVNETSQGQRNIYLSRLRSEIFHWRELRKHLSKADIVYLPLVNYGLVAVLMKKLGFIKIPLVGIIHSISYRGINRKVYYEIAKALDFIIFLSEKTRQEFEHNYNHRFSNKTGSIELMPEIEPALEERYFEDHFDYDVCMIGKTNRDYKTFSEAVDMVKCKALLVGGVEADSYKSDYIDTYSSFISYRECRNFYRKSRINLVITKEANGIFGLTSIVDSLQNGLPIIATRTKEMAVDVEGEQLGLVVSPYDSAELAEAIKKLLTDSRLYNQCVERLRHRVETHNAKVFAREICSIFDSLLMKSEK